MSILEIIRKMTIYLWNSVLARVLLVLYYHKETAYIVSILVLTVNLRKVNVRKMDVLQDLCLMIRNVNVKLVCMIN
jgi:hypothetical protein